LPTPCKKEEEEIDNTWHHVLSDALFNIWMVMFSNDLHIFPLRNTFLLKGYSNRIIIKGQEEMMRREESKFPFYHDNLHALCACPCDCVCFMFRAFIFRYYEFHTWPRHIQFRLSTEASSMIKWLIHANAPLNHRYKSVVFHFQSSTKCMKYSSFSESKICHYWSFFTSKKRSLIFENSCMLSDLVDTNISIQAKLLLVSIFAWLSATSSRARGSWCG
jgi:hypothetical protein